MSAKLIRLSVAVTSFAIVLFLVAVDLDIALAAGPADPGAAVIGRLPASGSGDARDLAALEEVVLAVGACANHSLAESLAELDIPLEEVGDCSGVSYIEGAMHEGNRAGRAV